MTASISARVNWVRPQACICFSSQDSVARAGPVRGSARRAAQAAAADASACRSRFATIAFASSSSFPSQQITYGPFCWFPHGPCATRPMTARAKPPCSDGVITATLPPCRQAMALASKVAASGTLKPGGRSLNPFPFTGEFPARIAAAAASRPAAFVRCTCTSVSGSAAWCSQATRGLGRRASRIGGAHHLASSRPSRRVVACQKPTSTPVVLRHASATARSTRHMASRSSRSSRGPLSPPRLFS